MSQPRFVHLRVHSAYSLLEGAVRLDALAKRCRHIGMPAVAVTDRANLFGALEFSQTLAKSGIQPIVGCLLPVVPPESGRNGAGRGARPPHLPVLVKDATGYRNLLKLLSAAYLGGEASGPAPLTIDRLAAHGEGLIALGGGPEGPLGHLLAHGHLPRAEALLRELAGAFPGRFYVELMRHGIEDEDAIEPHLIALADRLALPLVATNDVHFLDAETYEAHDALLCISGGTQVGQPDRRRLTPEHRFKSAAEMAALFADIPEAVANTVVIAKRCAFMVEPHDPILPAFPTAADRSEPEELRAQAKAGLEQRLERHVFTEGMSAGERESAAAPYRDRLDYELGVIIQMQFPGYFLIVADFISWAKREGIPVGPGRGSGAGSVVAWSLGITDLDPLRFGLFFERFLNPERVSMPDFDIDFCQDRRDEVIRYVADRYGHDRVAHIITFGKLQARAVLRDVGRVLGLAYGLVDRISKLVPHNPANPPTLEQALAMEPRLEDARAEDPHVARMIDIARQLEGLPRHASTHAAGVVIGDRPLDELVPLYRDPRSQMPVTQFNMKDVEKAGLVKFDFLGLTTLTLLDKAVDMLRARGTSLDLETLPLDDAAAYELLSRAETAGVFQLESGGMRDALRKLKPDCFEDIVAMVALYRPGPMDNIPRYIACKHGEEDPAYLHPKLEPILNETQGVIIYQEQVMQIAQDLAGYTLGAADLLRRAMGKKIKAEMDAQREIFIKGATARGIEKGMAVTIFEQVAKFASYGFNKAHAAAYALIAYQTAYLKANHPIEFFAAAMSVDKGNWDKLALFRQELDRLSIPLLPPDVNRSGVDFTVEGGGEGAGIRYALSAVKGVGEQAMRALVEEREAAGPYRDLFDLCARLGGKMLGKRMLEALIKAGGMDGFGIGRAALIASLERALRYASAVQEQAESAQESLFGGATPADAIPRPDLAAAEEWPALERLQQEFDALGFYMSAHPLDGYRAGLRQLGITPAAELGERPDESGGARVKLAGILLGKQERSSARGRFAFVQLSDPSGAYEITVFSELLAQTRDLLESGRPLLVIGDARRENDGVKILAAEIQPLDDHVGRARAHIEIRLRDPDLATRLVGLLDGNGSGARVRLVLPLGEDEVAIDLPPEHSLAYARRADLETLAGVEAVRDL